MRSSARHSYTAQSHIATARLLEPAWREEFRHVRNRVVGLEEGGLGFLATGRGPAAYVGLPSRPTHLLSPILRLWESPSTSPCATFRLALHVFSIPAVEPGLLSINLFFSEDGCCKQPGLFRRYSLVSFHGG